MRDERMSELANALGSGNVERASELSREIEGEPKPKSTVKKTNTSKTGKAK